MSWLVQAIITPVITYVGGALAKGVVYMFNFYAQYQRSKEKFDQTIHQSELVDSIAEQIKALQKQGKPVPPELEQRLVDESSKINVGKSSP